MILCICRVVRDADVDRAVASGACTLDDVMFETGACTGCGTCTQVVADRLEHARSSPGPAAELPKSSNDR